MSPPATTTVDFAKTHVVDVTTTELADVSRDLCVFASLLFAADQRVLARTLVDQAAELLSFRTLLARSRRRSSASDGCTREPPRSGLVPPWMN
jgi:hypothetical protein